MDPMNEQKLQERYKAEADTVLFDGLKFDDRLKNAVLEQLKSMGELPMPVRRPRIRFKRWLYGIAVSVAAVLVLLSLPSMLENDFEPLPEDGVSILQAGVDTVSTEEALTMLEGKLELPSYTVNSFKLQEETVVSRGVNNSVVRAEFLYRFGEQTYTFAVDTEKLIAIDLQLETIKLDNEITGYMNQIDEATTALYWEKDQISYAIVGDLPLEEAARVANSVRMNN